MDFPPGRFEEWTLVAVLTLASVEPIDLIPGSDRKIYGAWTRLAQTMEAAGVTTVGELDPIVQDSYREELAAQYMDDPPPWTWLFINPDDSDG